MLNNKNNNELNFEFEGEETINISQDDNIYPLKEIRIDKGRMSIYEIKRKIDDTKRGNIKLDPAFQRGDEKWTIKQNSELIESILMGIPLPVIYFFQDEKGLRQVVDGRQRLTCIIKFLNDEFKLSSLKIIPNINNKKFSELEPMLQNKLEDYQLEIYTMLPPTPERVKFDIFDRLNRGGTRLNNQEMRNALYNGTSTSLINKMSELESFKSATGNSIKTKDMKDRYLLLRFVSFYLLKKRVIQIDLVSDIDEFLANAMKEINKFDLCDFDDFVAKFNEAMTYIAKKYGDSVFRFTSKDTNRKRPINMGLFETISYLFMLALEYKIDIDKNEIEKLKNEEFDKPERFTYGIDSKNNIEFRFGKIEELLGINNDK